MRPQESRVVDLLTSGLEVDAMLRTMLASLLCLQLCACKMPTSTKDSQPAFASGDWWAQPAANLVVAVHN